MSQEEKRAKVVNTSSSEGVLFKILALYKSFTYLLTYLLTFAHNATVR